MARIVLTAQDEKAVEAWLKTHDTACPIMVDENGAKRDMPDVGMLGARLSYTVTPSNMGNLGEVSCACGAKTDLPDEYG